MHEREDQHSPFRVSIWTLRVGSPNPMPPFRWPSSEAMQGVAASAARLAPGRGDGPDPLRCGTAG